CPCLRAAAVSPHCSVAALHRFRDRSTWLKCPRTGLACRLARALVALAAALPLEAHPEPGGTFMVGACKLETIGPGAITAIVDGRTLLLDGGASRFMASCAPRSPRGLRPRGGVSRSSRAR